MNEGARVLPFPTRPDGKPYRLHLARDYQTDAVKDGEPCPVCRATDWRLTPPGLWMDDAGHYWSPARQVEEATSDPAQPVEIETGVTAPVPEEGRS